MNKLIPAEMDELVRQFGTPIRSVFGELRKDLPQE